ncbi:MAG: hypothetical protein E7579_05825 [Ruminococcaceae bacterium]|nr:hypothetical protein [Oscillospiraceae bacterium]
MRCSPSQKNPRVAVMIAALLIFGGIAYAIPIFCNANGIAIGGAVFQLVTVAAVVAAVFLAVRYQMTHFVYLIRPRSDIDETGMETALAGNIGTLNAAHLPADMLDFVVIRSQGNRAGAAECVLSIADLAAVIPVEKIGTDKKRIRERYQADGYVYYDYTVTLGLDNALALVFIDGNRYAGIFIEPDEAMRAYFLGLGKTKKLG